MAPSSPAKLPAAQKAHSADPDDAAYAPAGQFMQLDDEKDPVDPKNVPAAQFVQLVWPVLEAYAPAEQLVQEFAPVDIMNDPRPQLLHALAAALA